MTNSAVHNGHGPLSVAGAERILRLAPTGHLDYGSLTEAEGTSPHGKPWEQDPEGHRMVTRGFGDFMRVVVDEVADKLGAPRLSADRDLSSLAASRSFILGAQNNGEGISSNSGEPHLPWLQYQNKRAADYHSGEPQKPDLFPDYLHFGTAADISGELDEHLASTIRLYVDAWPEHIPELAARTSQAFINLSGHFPHGKFREAATSMRDVDRHDGLIFFIRNVEDLASLVAISTYVVHHRPEMVNGRPRVLSWASLLW